MRFGIWRFVVAPSNAPSKNCKLRTGSPKTARNEQVCVFQLLVFRCRCIAIYTKWCAQLQSLRCIIAPKLFWKIYFLYDFWCAQTCSFRAVFGQPVQSLTMLAALYSVKQKKFYIGAHLHCRP